MARLIDADALKQKKTVLWDPALGFCECVLMDDIDDALTMEMTHAEWLPTSFMIPSVMCSECSYPIGKEYATEYNYCPNCGTRVDGDNRG